MRKVFSLILTGILLNGEIVAQLLSKSFEFLDLSNYFQLRQLLERYNLILIF